MSFLCDIFGRESFEVKPEVFMKADSKDYKTIQNFYESCLAEHGPVAKGMDWDSVGLVQRFAVMAEGLKNETGHFSILDLGCGVGFFLDYLKLYHPELEYTYTGIDVSQKMVDGARGRHPGADFRAVDLIKDSALDAFTFDYIVINGVFTLRVGLERSSMEDFVEELCKKAFSLCNKMLAVNFMSKHVQWEKDRLFHYPFDEAAAFFAQDLSRHFLFRADYGLWEYTAYIFKSPREVRAEHDQYFIEKVLEGA